jgi:hypothetical protein
MKQNKQKKKAEALNRYFLVSYKIFLKRTIRKDKVIEGQLSCTTSNGRYINKQVLFTKLCTAYKLTKRRVLKRTSIIFPNIQELRGFDYKEYNLVAPGQSIKSMKEGKGKQAPAPVNQPVELAKE